MNQFLTKTNHAPPAVTGVRIRLEHSRPFRTIAKTMSLTTSSSRSCESIPLSCTCIRLQHHTRYIFDGEGGEPVIDFSDVSFSLHVPCLRTMGKCLNRKTDILVKACSKSGDPVFKGTELADCSSMASQIETCQKAGKIVTVSYVYQPSILYTVESIFDKEFCRLICFVS